MSVCLLSCEFMQVTGDVTERERDRRGGKEEEALEQVSHSIKDLCKCVCVRVCVCMCMCAGTKEV